VTSAIVTPSDLGVPVSWGSLRVDGHLVRWTDSVREGTGTSPVVLVHGTGGSTQRHFPFLFPMLAAEQRVVSIDLATPDGDPAEGPDRLADQVLAVLGQVFAGRPVTLVGYSLGAVVAAVVAARAPASVRALVLAAGWIRTDTQQRLRNDVWHALRGTPDALARYHVYCAYSAPYLGLRTAAEIEGLLAGARADEDTARQMLINREVDLTDVAPRITSPTLVVAGTDDQMTPARQGKRLFGAIPDARYTEVTSGHAMVAERGAELVHLVNAFTADPSRHPAGSVLPARRP
jgi:pimeloyl-ACP methyl ester carboxylesterase